MRAQSTSGVFPALREIQSFRSRGAVRGIRRSNRPLHPDACLERDCALVWPGRPRRKFASRSPPELAQAFVSHADVELRPCGAHGV
eukprot:scaffold613_cov243-Pinguiococcus_pyrenoidosus.AAC.20